LGIDTDFLQNKGVDITGYDPQYRPDYPSEKYDTLICNYVLNVLLPEEQAHVLMAVSELLKSCGKAFYAVRRDIKKNGFRYNPKHKCKTYQCNVTLPYHSLLRTEHCEIYQYQHINQLPSPKTTFCLLCHPSPEQELITESATAFALANDSSSTKGDTIVIPKRHVDDYFDLTFKEQCACWLVVNRIKDLLQAKFQPAGFKIELAPNSTIAEHTHIHVTPQF